MNDRSAAPRDRVLSDSTPRAKSRVAVLAVALALTLAACQSSEEKAEGFNASGVELRETGDVDRAIIEFRNAISYDESHEEARRNLAEIFLERGDLARAFRQYSQLAEFHPDDAGARAALALIAMEAGDWDEARIHGPRAIAAMPDSVPARVIELSLEYRQAVLDDDVALRDELTARADTLLQEAPENVTLWQIVVSESAEEDPERSLEGLDALIELRPGDFEYRSAKLRLLTALDRIDEARTLLEGLEEDFPGVEAATELTVAWYMGQQDYDAAIAALQREAGDDTGDPRDHAAVIGLIRTIKGPEAALAELERLIAANAEIPENLAHYRALRASERLRQDERPAAIAELRDILETTERLPGRLLWIKALLADVLRLEGDIEGATTLIEEIFARDTTNVDALKVRGTILVSQDRPDEAIVDLRRALDQDPRDSSVLLLLAEAHQRAGSTDLMGERLRAAVEVSQNAVPETLRYVAFLLSQGRTSAVRTLLADARRSNPADVALLTQIGRFALQEGDFRTVEGVIADLSSLDDENAQDVSQVLRTAVLLQQDRRDEGIDLLMEQAGTSGENVQAVLAVIIAWVQADQPEQARLYIDRLREAAPDDLGLQLLDGAFSLSEGDPARSDALMRDIIERAPESPQAATAMQTLFERMSARGREADAEIEALLDRLLTAQPETPTVQLIKAIHLELQGDIEGAIAIYESLYETDTSNVLVANNLASLLAVHRDDADSLARASRIAQRLRGTEVPAFQDTYGWIAYREGNHEEALQYLEPAAARLSTDPLVQYHLGMTYRALGRTDDAAEALTRAVDLGADRDLPQIAEARAILDGTAETVPGTGGETPPASAESLPEGNASGN